MDYGPLVNEEIEEGATLARKFSEYAPLKVAFWAKANGEDQRYLFLASDSIDSSNFDDAYREALKLAITDMDVQFLHPMRIKVVSGSDERAKDALALVPLARRTPIRTGGARLGDTYMDDIYIYPKATIEPMAQAA